MDFARSQRKLGGVGVTYADPNQQQGQTGFNAETRKKIAEYMKDFARNEKNIRGAMIQAYCIGSRLWRIIQYFVGLTDLCYVVVPYQADAKKVRGLKTHLQKAMDFIGAFGLEQSFKEILTVCLREDVYYGTIREDKGGTLIQRLPSDYCRISEMSGSVYNVSFDFSYFNGSNNEKLAWYSDEMRRRYEDSKKKGGSRWQTLDAPASFAVKCNADIFEFAIPPFVGVLRDVFDIEAYQGLKLEKTAIENVAMIIGEVELGDSGDLKIDTKRLIQLFDALREVLPPQIGAGILPAKIQKISFDRAEGAGRDSVSEAEEHLFNSAGVSSLLFSNAKASSHALLLSIKADQAITFKIVESLGAVLNRYLHAKPFGKNLSVKFLDISRYNRDETAKAYLGACQYGFPFVSHYAAALGITQAEMDGLEAMENDILDVRGRFIPLQGSATISAGEPGRPAAGAEELTDSGEASHERD